MGGVIRHNDSDGDFGIHLGLKYFHNIRENETDLNFACPLIIKR